MADDRHDSNNQRLCIRSFLSSKNKPSRKRHPAMRADCTRSDRRSSHVEFVRSIEISPESPMRCNAVLSLGHNAIDPFFSLQLITPTRS